MAVPKRLRFEVFRRDNHTCAYCGRTPPEVKLQPDHVVPEVLGGKTEAANLVTSCADCNAGKSATPPDAPLVESVSQSAIRWSAAMTSAAELMLADLDVRDSHRAKFETKWNGWKAGGETLPLPSDWARSVDRFMAAGLPMPALLDCVDLAMSVPKVKPTGLFRYMCGIAWSRVTELQETARGRADGGAATPQPESTDWLARGRADFARELLADHLDDSERSLVLTHVQDCSKRAEQEDGEPYTPEQVLTEAAYNAFSELVGDRESLSRAVKGMLAFLPADEVALCREMAEREAREYLPADQINEALILSGTARWLTLYRRYCDLPEAEQVEWSECYLVSNAEPELLDILKVAEYVWACKEHGRYALPGNCVFSGEHGAMCPARAAFAVVVESCNTCRSNDRERCPGHAMCGKHATQLVDGDYTSNATGETVVVREITELTVSA